jgi:perosamine synthetase
MAAVTAFSLHARKVVTTGESGKIVTNDAALAQRLRRLRHQGMSLGDLERHGARPTAFEIYPEIGYNFRLTDIQAAIGLSQLDRLSDMLARRCRTAQRYVAALTNHPFLDPPFVLRTSLPIGRAFRPACGQVDRSTAMRSWMRSMQRASPPGAESWHRIWKRRTSQSARTSR